MKVNRGYVLGGPLTRTEKVATEKAYHIRDVETSINAFNAFTTMETIQNSLFYMLD